MEEIFFKMKNIKTVWAKNDELSKPYSGFVLRSADF